MTAPQLSKAWSINPNVRKVYTSVLNVAGWWIYQNHAYLKAGGWTVIGTSNGITAAFDGPGGDRMINDAAGAVRGATATDPQSWTVLQNVDGVELLIAHQHLTTDSGVHVGFSPGGLYVLNTPTTGQPTATDEVVIANQGGSTGTNTDGDRVMTIWASGDTRHWMCSCYRQGTIMSHYGVERVIDLCAPGVFSVPYVASRYTAFDRAATIGTPIGGTPSIAVGAAGFIGNVARVFTALSSRLTRIGCGDVQISGVADGFNRSVDAVWTGGDYPPLQGASGLALLPIFWTGERTANLDGFVGSPIDWWFAPTSSLSIPNIGNFVPGFDPGDTPGVTPLRANWLLVLGSAVIRPWRDAAASFLTS
jgi:hypothetical protein